MSALAAGRASGDTFDALPRALDGVARIAPTGGTTGEPKAVMMTHQTLVMLSLAMCAYFDMANRPR